MELNRYDRVIWRINGAFFAVGGLLALVLMLIAGYKLLHQMFRERRVHTVVNVNQETRQNEYLALKSFSHVQGTGWLVASLEADQDYQQAYYSKSASSTRNYLFFDVQDRTTRWVLGNHSSLILTSYVLYEDTSDEREKRKVIGFVYEVVKNDSNGDRRLTWDDKKSLVLYRVSANEGTGLLDAVDEFLGVEQISSSEVLVFFRDSQQSFFVSLDLASGKLGKKTELPSISNNAR